MWLRITPCTTTSQRPSGWKEALQKKTRASWWTSTWTSDSSASSQQRRSTASWASLLRALPESQGRWLLLFMQHGWQVSGVLCPILGYPVQKAQMYYSKWKFLMERSREDGIWFFPGVSSEQTDNNGYKYKKSDFNVRKTSFMVRTIKALEQVAHSGCSLHLCRYSKPNPTVSWATSSSWSCSELRGWIRSSSGVPSDLNYSVIGNHKCYCSNYLYSTDTYTSLVLYRNQQ